MRTPFAIASAFALVGLGCKDKESPPPPSAGTTPAVTSASAAPAASATAHAPPPSVRWKTPKAKRLTDLGEPPPSSEELAALHLKKGTSGRCGGITVDGVDFPLDCMAENDDPPQVSAPIVHTTLLRHTLRPRTEHLPEEVDHRRDKTEGAVRAQSKSESCTAFSFASAVDHALSRTAGHAGPVSVLHAWARYHEPSQLLAAKTNVGKRLAPETAWPFDAQTACEYMGCDPKTHSTRCPVKAWACAQPVDTGKLASLDTAGIAVVSQITEVDRVPTRDKTDFGAIREVLARGQDVWFCMRVDGHMQLKKGDSILPDFDATKRTAANGITGHCLLLAGYRVQANGVYFLIHNSWGDRWGDSGYAWIHEKTLAKNISTVTYVVDAAPNDPAEVRPREGLPPPFVVKKTVTAHACAAGTVKDSINGVCRAPCKDGSPPHDGVCAIDGHCDDGYVNLTGACVLSAPNARGTDAATGVSYACGAGGCAYTVPAGKLGCTGGAPCQESCAAPRFLLSYGSDGLGCTE